MIAYFSFFLVGCGYKSDPYYHTPTKKEGLELLYGDPSPSVPMIDDGTLEHGELLIKGSSGTQL